MKKVFLTVMLVLCLGLVGCGDSQEKTTQPAGNQTTASGYKFTYNNTDVYMHAKADTIIAGLGKYTDCFEADSCAFQGKDKIYTYPGFKVYTYQKDSAEYILSVELVDDSVATPEGIEIGSKAAKVVEKYGNSYQDTVGAYKYTKDKSNLTFIIKNDEVTGILYDAVID